MAARVARSNLWDHAQPLVACGVLCVGMWAGPALAGWSPQMTCMGADWDMKIDDAGSGALSYLITTEMDVMNVTTPQGAPWPKALTLVGARDTAIVIVQQDLSVIVLTQRGQTPVMLTGACKAPPRQP